MPGSTRAISGPVLPSALVIAAAYLLSHPFTGIRHDGILYLGDALVRLLPGEFHDDLYFRYGSQGRFTVLPAVYAALIAAFGLGTGTIVGLLAAAAAYLAAAAWLIRWLAPRALRDVCLLAVVLGWTLYGGNRVFAYSEAFLTARSFAEPAVLAGLALLVRRRFVAASLVLALSLAIHPLIGLGGVLVAWVWAVGYERRWLLPAAAALVGLVVLAATGTAPFDDLFARYDADWYALLKDANSQAFVTQWSHADYGIIAFNAVVLGFVAATTERRDLRRFAIAVLIAGLGATVVSFAMVDVASNPFFGKLQIWRAEWILQWCAMAALPLAVVALWRRGEPARVAALFLAIGWMAAASLVPGVLGVMAALVYALRDRFTVTPLTTRIVAGVTVIAALTIAIQYEMRVFTLGRLLAQSIEQVVGQALAMNLLLFAAAFGVLWLRGRPGRAARRAAPLCALVLLGVGAINWDQRAPWTHQLESYAPGTHIWTGLVEPDAKVYWYRDLMAPWILLGHGNYYTMQQGSGAVFSRDMMVEFEKRRKVTALLDFQEQICRTMNNLSEKQTSCEPDAVAVRTVCDEGGIDYAVLQSTLEGAKPLASFPTHVLENGYEKTFYLYRCAALKPG